MGWRDGYIAVDWGTTNRRAYALDGGGELESSFEDDLGLMAVPEGGFATAAAGIRERLGERPMLMAGMVGSDRGWIEAPYVPCPAGLAELAAAIRWVEPGRIGIVPGVCQSTPDPDVMRGEEVQVLGAAATGSVASEALICHPGTHAKWIRIAGGRIEAFTTMMTGELFSLLRRHSILADQLKGEVSAGDGFVRGADSGLAGEPVTAALFGIRARHLLGESAGDGASFASGLLIGSDVRAGLRLHRGEPIVLIGRPDLCALYAQALQRCGHSAGQVDGAEAFLAGMRKLTELI